MNQFVVDENFKVGGDYLVRYLKNTRNDMQCERSKPGQIPTAVGSPRHTVFTTTLFPNIRRILILASTALLANPDALLYSTCNKKKSEMKRRRSVRLSSTDFAFCFFCQVLQCENLNRDAKCGVCANVPVLDRYCDAESRKRTCVILVHWTRGRRCLRSCSSRLILSLPIVPSMRRTCVLSLRLLSHVLSCTL